MPTIKIELLLLIMSALFFLSILAGKASSKFGVPALLLFLGVGMLFGILVGGNGVGMQFKNIQFAYNIGTVALCIILFSGGLDTNISEIRPVIAQGVILATLGVFLTAIITGFIVWWVLGKTMQSAGIGILSSLLLASTMSSTDSASVFSILRSKGLHLKNNLRPMLELESGSNDPMAYILVITFIEMIQMGSEPNYWLVGGKLILQLIIGTILGFALGKAAVRVINLIEIGNDSLYPILLFTFCIFIFSITHFFKGNGFLAVYIAGLVIGNSKFIHKRTSLYFFDGLAWMSQLIMFLTLGLLVNTRELLPVIVPALIISFSMIFISRPLTVLLCLLPFRKMPVKEKVYVSWVGLRGAVPIIFAIFPLVAGVPHAGLFFNIVFFCTLISLLVQGTSLPAVARRLNLTDTPKEMNKLKSFDVDFSGDIKSITTEIELTEKMLSKGNRLANLAFPDKTLVVLVMRDDKYFVPTGKTVLKEKDVIMIITDDREALIETYKNLGIENY